VTTGDVTIFNTRCTPLDARPLFAPTIYAYNYTL